jgi:hypothetical protein
MRAGGFFVMSWFVIRELPIPKVYLFGGFGENIEVD